MEKSRINKKELFKIIKMIIIVIIVVVVLFLIRLVFNKKAEDYLNSGDSTFAKNVLDDNKLLKIFKEKCPDREVILACEEDITDDSIKDLVVISKKGNEIETIALIDKGNGNYLMTEPILAPKENQFIKFFNMDKTGAIEVLITGEKKGQVGYAIYRYEDGKLIDIFGEGMEDCC